MEKDISSFYEELAFDEERIRELNPIALAYVGDVIYELLVRVLLVNSGKKPSQMQRDSIRYVSAKAQTKNFKVISEILTEEELKIFKRGRNRNPKTVPKNQDISDYRIATGVEALFGYLYLIGDMERILELFYYMVNK